MKNIKKASARRERAASEESGSASSERSELKSKRIGIDCRIFSSRYTGIGRCNFELVKNLAKINEQLEQPHKFVLFFNNPEYREFKCPPNFKKILANVGHYSLKEQTKFPRIIRKENLDTMHFPHFNVPILYRRPYTVTIHDLTLSLFPGQKMNRWFHRLAYHLIIKNAVKTAKKVIAVSNNTAKDIVEHLKISEEKIKVIYNGIGKEFTLFPDSTVCQPTLKKYGIKKQFFLYTGVWRSHKNLPRLIEAFSILRKEKGLDFQLVITGKKDPHYPEVKNTVKKLKLEEDVVLPGMVDEKELIHLYNAAFIYAFPSLYEGFGLPPLESMKCGTPVVASNTSCIPEICGPENAIFFNPYNTEDIVKKILYLYKDADLQADLIEKGLEHASTFSWGKMAKETYKIIIKS